MDETLSWNLGGIDIPCDDNYTHLGIVVNRKCRLSDRIAASCTKGRKSYFALSDLGSPYLNPLTTSHLYKTVVLPSVLYGCELWNGISCQDLQKLNIFQHFVCKDILKVPKRFRSDICESLLNVLPIESEIDARKLLFFGRLCRMNCDTLPKQIFLARLFSHLENLANTQYGFIPDILRLLADYDLLPFLSNWLENGHFPEKYIWKKTVRLSVSSTHNHNRQNRIVTDPDLRDFQLIFEHSEPSSIWKAPTNSHDINVCKFICKLYSIPVHETNDQRHLCPLCNATVVNVFLHAACSCQHTNYIRDQWWSDIADMNINLCAELSGLPKDELYMVLLGRHTITPTALHTFRMLNFRLLRNAAAAYNRAIVEVGMPV